MPYLPIPRFSSRWQLGPLARLIRALILAVLGALRPVIAAEEATERTLVLEEITEEAVSLRAEVGESNQFTWWMPAGAEEYVLPLSAGIAVDPSREDLMGWLRKGSPWSLLEMPALGLRYGDRMWVVIVPWPHYAKLIVTDRVGIRFSFPEERRDASPCGLVAMLREGDPLEVARAFREWRRDAPEIGVIPRARLLKQKIAELPEVERLLGAGHFYLWGPALFSRHDGLKGKWTAFARALRDAPADSFGGRLVRGFSEDERTAVEELGEADWPMEYLTVTVAGAIDRALSDRDLLKLGPEASMVEVIGRNRQGLAEQFGPFLSPPATWGDGLSRPLLDSLHEAGIERALLLMSDLYGRSLRPDLTAHAGKLGYLLGPYDSYHSVHAPTAGPDETWETAQFDLAAYRDGRVVNSDGSGHAGFKGRGFHFSPAAAWPYVQKRVGSIRDQVPYSTWFVDCDATGECFDDYSSSHPSTKLEDTGLRRKRLAWLESEHEVVVGSEGGSVLFADVIHYGHGVHTPYIGHLDPRFRDRKSPHFLGRHWPPDSPELSFKPVPVAPALKRPYFDPTVRIPLYQAAVGDELITTHHWGFDSLKFADIQSTRQLLEILYLVPPMYHLNRSSWPERREEILRHLAFWGPLHRELAPAPLTGFAYLSDDRLLQRTTFEGPRGEVAITVNFGSAQQAGHPPFSATVSGAVAGRETVFRARP